MRAIVRGTALAAVCVLALAACGDGDKDSSSPGSGATRQNGDSLEGHEEASGLPSAGTMTAIETFVSQRTTCDDLKLEAEDENDDYPDGESVGKGWGIKERAICFDTKGMGIRLLSIDNMKQFQTRAKEYGGGYLIGQDFAVNPTLSSTEGFKGSGLLYLACDPDYAIPSGYKKEKALVEGCSLTDYIS